MNCGSRLSESDRFCAKCGSPVSRQNDQQDHSIQEQSGAIVYGVHKYEGTAKRLSFVGGLTIDVSAAKDATNEYQRQFKNYVNERMRSFQQEYRLKCRTFDGYMDNFVEINADYVIFHGISDFFGNNHVSCSRYHRITDTLEFRVLR